MNRITQVLSTTITLVTLIGLLVFVMVPASIFLAVYFLGQAGRSLLPHVISSPKAEKSLKTSLAR